jgi:hypothetical protein
MAGRQSFAVTIYGVSAADQHVHGWDAPTDLQRSLFLQTGHGPQRPDCLAGHVRLELRNVVANYPFPVTEMPHQTTFWKFGSPCSTIVPIFLHLIFLHKTVADREMAQGSSNSNRWRGSLGREIADTAPYKQWLAAVGSIVFALLCLLGSASLALAQRPDDFRRTFVTIAQSATVHAAQAEVERQDPQDPQPTGGQSSAYAVSGVVLGATVKFGSSAYREYKCGPSDQFDGFTWCQKTRKEKERRGKFNATYSILHSRDGVAVYINRYQEPAFFGASEADDDIQLYSRKIGETPRITRMPQRAGFPNGILASWGKVELEPLDNDSIKALAEGRRPTTKGYVVDFIGDFARSAKEGLPIYRISGGPGFVWVASIGQKGRGALRLTAVDTSVLAPATTPRAPIETVESAKEEDAIANATNQLSRGEAEKEAADKARIDAERAREDAVLRLTAVDASVSARTTTPRAPIATVESAKEEDAIANTTNQFSRGEAEKEAADKSRIDFERAREDAEKAREEAVRAKADTDKAAATERAKLNALFEQLEAEKGAAEAKARAMENVAYGAIIVLIVLVVTIASAFALRKRRIAGTEHQSAKAVTRKLEPTELAAVMETKSASDGDSHHSESKDASCVASRSRQVAQLFPSPPGPAVILGIMIAAVLSAGVIGTILYPKTFRPYEHWTASRIAESTKVQWKFRVKKSGIANRDEAIAIGWQENEHGAAAEIIGECVDRSINFKATVLGRDTKQTVELPWDDKLEDYRNEIGKFMQVIFLPIAVKINDDEPQLIKRLHEEPYRNVIRLVTLLSDSTPPSDRQQSARENSNNVLQLDDLLSTAEKAALTLYYPDKKLKASEVRRIMVQFDTSKGTMLIKIMTDDPTIQKFVHFCQINNRSQLEAVAASIRGLCKHSQEFSATAGLRGGPGKIRTSNQTVMSSRL